MARTKKTTTTSEPVIEIQDTTTEVAYTYTLRQKLLDFPALSLRRIATSLDVNYNMMLKAGKKAKAGEVYNPDVANYDAIEDYLVAKLGIDEYEQIDWPALAKDAEKQRTTNVAKDIKDFSSGTLLTLRSSDTLYKVIHMTNNEIVIAGVTEGSGGQEFDLDVKPRVLNHDTFFHQGPKHFTSNTEEAEG